MKFKSAVQTLCTVLFLFFVSTSFAQNSGDYNEERIASQVDSVMQSMSLTDKVGEMTQLSIDMISKGQPYNLEEPHSLDEEKLSGVISIGDVVKSVIDQQKVEIDSLRNYIAGGRYPG